MITVCGLFAFFVCTFSDILAFLSRILFFFSFSLPFFLFFFSLFLRRQNKKSSRSGRKKSRHFAQSSSKTRLYCLFTSLLLLLLLHCSLTRRTPHRKREKKTPCIPAPKKAHDRCSEKPRRLRRDVGVRQDRGERRGSVRDPHLGILTEDAIDRRRLCTFRRDKIFNPACTPRHF